MKALLIHHNEFNEPIVEISDIPIPLPKGNEVLVKIHACGICGHDVSVVNGILKRGIKKSIVPGHEFSGTVVDLGNSSSKLNLNDRVISALNVSCGKCENCYSSNNFRCTNNIGIGTETNGGMAEFVAIPETNLIKIPNEINLLEASLFPCPIGVAFNSIGHLSKTNPNQKILVVGAGGGLGTHILKILSPTYENIIALTSSEHKVEHLKTLGAKIVLTNENNLDFSELIYAFTEEKGSDVIFNIPGSKTFEASLKSLAIDGTLLLLGETSKLKANFPISEAIFRSATIKSVLGASEADIENSMQYFLTHKLHPEIDSIHSLENWSVAFDRINTKQSIGRVVITP